MKNMTRILSAAILVCGIILAVGALYVFHACGPMDDGSWMKCHWAQQISASLGVVIAVQAVIAIASKTRAGVSAAIIPTAILAILVPNTIIPLCMMSDMRCQSIMKPAVWLVAGIILILAVVNTILSIKSEN